MRTDHLERIERLAGDAEALSEVAAALREIGGLTDAAKKEQERLEQLQGMRAEEHQKLQGVVDDIAVARQEAAQLRADAKADAEAMMANAGAEARAAVDAAEAAAKQAGEEASRNSAATLASARAENDKVIARARRDLAEIEAATEAAKVNAAAATEEAATAQAELERIQTALAEARTKIGL